MRDSIVQGKRPPEFVWDHDPLAYHGCGLTGYTGLNAHSILQLSVLPAVRTQIGWRGLGKSSLAVLPDGDLVAVAIGTGKPIPMYVFRSSDEGASWRKIEHTPIYGKEPHLTCLKNGALLLTVEDIFNNTSQSVYYSEDGGQSWSVTRMLAFEDGDVSGNATPMSLEGRLVIARSPIEHPDGSISLLSCWGYAFSSQAKGAFCRAWLRHSTDGGRTWPEREEIETWADWFYLFREADLLTLPDGRILATTCFEFDHPIAGTRPPWPPGSVPNDHSAGHMVLLESSDEGRHWTPPRDFLSYSEVQGQLTLLSDGRILCTYTHYHLPFGVAAVLSNDLGRTWDLDHPFQLALSNGIHTGWGVTRQLPCGSLLTAYAIEPYHLEPREKGIVVSQCVRWDPPQL